MDNIPRLSFYILGVLIISVAFTLLSAEFLFLMADPGWKGTAILLGFGLVYMNIVFVVSRRFMRRLEGHSPAPYLLGMVVALAPVVWIFIYDHAGLDLTQQILYTAVMLLACGSGAYFGHRAGLKAQVVFRQKVEEYLKNTGRLPEDQQRPDNNLN